MTAPPLTISERGDLGMDVILSIWELAEQARSALAQVLGEKGLILFAAASVLLMSLAVSLWIIPRQRLRPTAQKAFARPLQAMALPNLSSKIWRPAAPAMETDVGKLTLKDLDTADVSYRTPRSFRVVNDWQTKGKLAAKWNSKDCFICLQPAVITFDNLDVETAVYRITVDDRPPLFASILPRIATHDFDAKRTTDGSLCDDALAIGFNRAALDHIDIKPGKSVRVSISPNLGVRGMSYAVQGRHSSSDINISTLFLLISLPVGFATAFFSAIFDHFTDPGDQSNWLVRAMAMALGLIVSAIVVRSVRSAK
jgi:hypothetical protein